MGNITTLLFDLGGVLIELGPLSDLMATSPIHADDIWRSWTRSPSVRRHESGQSSSEQFAEEMIVEFRLDTTSAEFLRKFNEWPRGPYEGAITLLDSLASEYQLACLSNTNRIHWDNVLSQTELMSRFEHAFLSHQTGLLKPDSAAFTQVSATLGIAPEQILFIDDNEGNVNAARSSGMHAAQATTPAGVIQVLNRMQLTI